MLVVDIAIYFIVYYSFFKKKKKFFELRDKASHASFFPIHFYVMCEVNTTHITGAAVVRTPILSDHVLLFAAVVHLFLIPISYFIGLHACYVIMCLNLVLK